MEEGHVITGKYRIVRRIGVGGMGAVYEVERVTRGIHFRYALKQLRRELEENPDVTRRFIDEARRMVELLHPNIVRIIDIDDDPDFGTFILMELINGPNLSQVIREQGRRPYSEVLRLGAEIGSALDFAHSKGVIHRDIKPQNILIEDGTGRAVLTDFGIAKKIRLEGDETDGTKTGFFIGTQRYASPQQMRNETPEPRWDIYSLGAVLYEAFSGRRYLEDMNENQIFGNVGFNPGWKPTLEFPVPPPPRFMRVIEECLEKERELRIENATDLVRRLRECLNDSVPELGEEPIAPPAAPPAEEAETKKERYEARRAELRAQAEERLRLLDGLEAAATAMGVSGEWTSTETMRASLEEISRLEADEQFGESMGRLEALCEHGTEVRRSIETALNEAFSSAVSVIETRWSEVSQRCGSFLPAGSEQDLRRAVEAARESMRANLWGEASRRLADGRAVVEEAATAAASAARTRLDSVLAAVEARHAELPMADPEAAAPFDVAALRTDALGAIDDGRLSDAVRQAEDAEARMQAALEAARRAGADRFAKAHAELERAARAVDADAARAAAPAEVERAGEQRARADDAARRHDYREALAAAAAASNAYREAEARVIARRGEEGQRQQLSKRLRDVEQQIAAVEGLHEVARGLGAAEGGAKRLRAAREGLKEIDPKPDAARLEHELQRAAAVATLAAEAAAEAETALGNTVKAGAAALGKRGEEMLARAGRFLAKESSPGEEIGAAERCAAGKDWKGAVKALAEAAERLDRSAAAARRDAEKAVGGLLGEVKARVQSLTDAGRASDVDPDAARSEAEKLLAAGDLQAAAAGAEAVLQRLNRLAEQAEREDAERAAAARAGVEGFLQKADAEGLRRAAAQQVAAAEKARGEAQKAEGARRYHEATASYQVALAAYEEAAKLLADEQEKRIAGLRSTIEAALSRAADAPAAAVAEGKAAATAALGVIGREERGRAIAQLESAKGLLESQLKEAPACVGAIAKSEEAAAAEARVAGAGLSADEKRDAVRFTAEARKAFEGKHWAEARDRFTAAAAAWAKLERLAEERVREAEERARRLGEAKKQLAATAATARQAPETLAGAALSQAEAVLGAADATIDDVRRVDSDLNEVLAQAPLFRSADEQRARAKALEARVVEEGFKPRALKGARRSMSAADGAFAARAWKDAGEGYAETFRVLRELEQKPRPAPSAVNRQIALAAGAALVLLAGGATVVYLRPWESTEPSPQPEPTVVQRPTVVQPEPTLPTSESKPSAAPVPPKVLPYLAATSPEVGKPVTVEENEAQVFSVEVGGLAAGASSPVEWLLDGKSVAQGTGEYRFKPDFAAARDKPYSLEAKLEGGEAGKSSKSWEVRVQDVNRNPRIVRQVPSADRAVQAKPGETLKFSVEASDEDGDSMRYAWKVDGKPAGKDAPAIDVKVAEGKGPERVTVEVGDGKSKSPATVGWDVALLKVPTPEPKLVDLSLRAVPKQLSSLPFASSQTFALEPSGTLPSGVDYEWKVDGQKVASGPSFRFSPDKQSFVRKNPVRIAALARAANARPFSYEWSVKVQPPAPKITSASPRPGDVESGAGSEQTFEVNASAPIGDQRFTYVFEVDGKENQRSERPTFRLVPRDNRDYLVASRVVDNYGNTSERTAWTLRTATITSLVEEWLGRYERAFNGKDADTLAALLKLDASKKQALGRSLGDKRELQVALKDVRVEKRADGGARATYKQTESFVDPTGQRRTLETSMKQNFRLVGGRVELEK